MRKIFLVVSSVLFFATDAFCIDDNPKEIAAKICLALQKMDYQELKKYADEPSIIKINKNENLKIKTQEHIKLLPADKRIQAQKSYDDKIWRAKSAMSALNCNNIIIMDGADDDNKVALIDNKPTSLKFIHGVWKLTQ